MTGKRVYSRSYEKDRATIDISSVDNGVYQVSVHNGSEYAKRKWVIAW